MASSLDRLIVPLAIRGAIVVEGDGAWDPGAAISAEANRWSGDGRRTAYLAGDPGVALAEAGRHLDPDDRVRVASLWSVDITVYRSLDLRDPAVATALDLPTDPGWILDRDRCRRVGEDARGRKIDALVVPSAAFLDNPERFDVVLFPEALDEPIETALRAPRVVAVLEPRQDGSSGR